MPRKNGNKDHRRSKPRTTKKGKRRNRRKAKGRAAD